MTTTASDDEFNIPTNTQDGIAVPTFLLLLARTRSSLRIPGSVCCPFGRATSAAVSVRRCRCHTCSSGTQQIPPPSTGPNAMLKLSFQCSGLTGNGPHRTFDVPVGLALSHWRSLCNSLASFSFFFALPTPCVPARQRDCRGGCSSLVLEGTKGLQDKRHTRNKVRRDIEETGKVQPTLKVLPSLGLRLVHTGSSTEYHRCQYARSIWWRWCH